MVTYTGSECSHDVLQYMPICSHVAIEAVVLYIPYEKKILVRN